MDDLSGALQADGDGTRIRVRLVPRAARTGLAGAHGDAVKLRVTAPPLDGRANAEALAFLARRLGVAKQAVELVSGHRSRDKVVRVAGLDPAAVAARL